MKNVLSLFIMSFSVACAQHDNTPKVPLVQTGQEEYPAIDYSVALEHPYEIAFETVPVNHGQSELHIDIKLFGGSFFVSPNEKKDFSGKFRVEIAPNDNLQLGADFEEIPTSKKVVDPKLFMRGDTYWVRESTQYKYPLQVNTTKDFQIGGKVIFTIEPKCTLEEIPIIFKFKNGELKVERWEC